MARSGYHLTPEGPKPCNATVRPCKYGGLSGKLNHYAGFKEATAVYEAEVKAAHEAGVKKSTEVVTHLSYAEAKARMRDPKLYYGQALYLAKAGGKQAVKTLTVYQDALLGHLPPEERRAVMASLWERSPEGREGRDAFEARANFRYPEDAEAAVAEGLAKRLASGVRPHPDAVLALMASPRVTPAQKLAVFTQLQAVEAAQPPSRSAYRTALREQLSYAHVPLSERVAYYKEHPSLGYGPEVLKRLDSRGEVAAFAAVTPLQHNDLERRVAEEEAAGARFSEATMEALVRRRLTAGNSYEQHSYPLAVLYEAKSLTPAQKAALGGRFPELPRQERLAELVTGLGSGKGPLKLISMDADAQRAEYELDQEWAKAEGVTPAEVTRLFASDTRLPYADNVDYDPATGKVSLWNYAA